jgi:hypothetical protein
LEAYFTDGLFNNKNYYFQIANNNGIISNIDDSYITGRIIRPITNTIVAGNRHQVFPVGGTKKKNTWLINSTNIGPWEVEYRQNSPSIDGFNANSMETGLEAVSEVEYWVIKGPNTQSADIRLTLNGTSEVAQSVGWVDRTDLRIVRWNDVDSEWQIVGGIPTFPTGSSIVDATIQINSLAFNGNDQYFTIGAVVPVDIPSAQITSSNGSICEGEDYILEITITGDNAPFEVDYSIGSDNYTETGIVDLIHTITLSADLSLGVNTITLTAIRDSDSPVNSGNILGGSVTVTVYAEPTAFEVTSGGNICGATLTTVNLSGSEVGFTYDLYRDGIYFSSLEGTGGALTFTGIDQAGTYTVEAYNTSFSGCTALMDGDAEIEFGSAASAQITDLITATICENGPVTIEITFTGEPPFTFTLQDDWGNSWIDQVIDFGVEPYVTTFTIPDQYPIWNPADPLPKVYTYTITSIVDDAGCGAGTVIGSGTSVNVYKIPETGPPFHIPNAFGE